MAPVPFRMIGIAVLMLAAAAFLLTMYDSDSSDATVTNGDCGKDGNNLRWEYDDVSHVLTITGSGEMRDYNKLDVMPWTECTSISLPDGMTTIGEHAFQNCTSLTSVTIPDSVSHINAEAFYNCTSLTSVTFPNSITYFDYAVFADCTSLTSISIPSSVTSIGECAFCECTSLTSVTIPATVDWIVDQAFARCSSLTSVTVLGSATIDIFAFYDCASLATITVEGSVDSIGGSAFMACPSLKSVTINGSVGPIDTYAFYDCKALETVTITGPITSIGSSSFEECTALKTVNIACNDPLNITKGSEDNGFIACYADTVNHVHRYSAAYDWADDGKTCTVHINCLNDSALISDEHPQVDSTVKIPPTETEKGTTEYSVSGTYDGYAYSDVKDVQDIPATGSGDGKKDDTLLYIAAGGAAAALAVAAFFLLRRPKKE